MIDTEILRESVADASLSMLMLTAWIALIVLLGTLLGLPWLIIIILVGAFGIMVKTEYDRRMVSKISKKKR